MKSEDEKLRLWFRGKTGTLVIHSCTASKSKRKFSVVREEQHIKFHALLRLQNDSPETGLQGIYKEHRQRFLVMA